MLVPDEQVTLYRLGFEPGLIDGVDGPFTRAARAAFLKSIGMSGATRDVLDRELERARQKLCPFVQAKNFKRARRPHSDPLNVIVIHTMEAHEKPGQALNVARWFADQFAPRYPAPMASAHYNVDDKQVVQSVLECDVAYHAPGANRHGIGIEHTGFASQTSAQWDDEYSRAVLERSAELVAALCVRFSIPMQRIDAADLVAGGRGICGHIDCTHAFSNGKGHVDPGPSFPWAHYIDRVKAFAGVARVA
jgi:N-acetyl-anhydromuramyl-L-alanine amidase AmpD